MNIAFVDWSLDIDCPHCKESVDLVEYEGNCGETTFANAIFSNRWDDLIGFDIECPHYKRDFQIDKVEY